MGFFDRLMNTDGTAIQESVLTDPAVIKEMANQKPTYGGAPRIWGFTREVGLLTNLIELQGRVKLKRPVIPGYELREQQKVLKLKSKLSKQFNFA